MDLVDVLRMTSITVRPPTGTSRSSYPTEENISRAPSGTDKANSPFELLEVPLVVPFTFIDTAGIGSPFSFVTLPVTCTSEANAVAWNTRTNNRKQNPFIYA